jgi:hypothetical protein
MEWALMLFMAMKTGAASELLGTYKTMLECQTVAELASQKAYEQDRDSDGLRTLDGYGSFTMEQVQLYYTCAPVPKAYIYE